MIDKTSVSGNSEFEILLVYWVNFSFPEAYYVLFRVSSFRRKWKLWMATWRTWKNVFSARAPRGFAAGAERDNRAIGTIGRPLLRR